MHLTPSKLLAGQASKFCRCYDNGGPDAGGSCDRYTVVMTGRYRHKTGGSFLYVAMNGSPFHPQGFGQHGESEQQIDVNKWGFAPPIGRKNHLGRRIRFQDLPEDCKKLVVRDIVELWK